MAFDIDTIKEGCCLFGSPADVACKLGSKSLIPAAKILSAQFLEEPLQELVWEGTMT